MKRAIFVLSQKGGAGKTTFARGLLETLRYEGVEVAAYDTDGAVGQLLQHEGQRDRKGALLPRQDPRVGCGAFDVRDDDDRDALLNALADAPPVVLFDLPGGVVGELGKVLDEGEAPRGLFGEYRARGYAVTVVVVMTPVKASVRTVAHSIESFGDAVSYVAVKNLAFGDPDAFINFDGCRDGRVKLPESEGKRALLARGGHILHMPRLDPRTYAWLDLGDLGFVEALESRRPQHRLPEADLARLKRWFKEFDEMLDPARHLLGFEASPRTERPSAGRTVTARAPA